MTDVKGRGATGRAPKTGSETRPLNQISQKEPVGKGWLWAQEPEAEPKNVAYGISPDKEDPAKGMLALPVIEGAAEGAVCPYEVSASLLFGGKLHRSKQLTLLPQRRAFQTLCIPFLLLQS